MPFFLIPVAIYLTAQTMFFVVWGFRRRTVAMGLLLLGVLALVTAAVTSSVLGQFKLALARGQSAQNLSVQYAIWSRLNVWIQVLGWPLLIGGFLLFWEKRSMTGRN